MHHFFLQCVLKNSTTGGQNDIKNLGVIRYHPEIEDVIRPVGVAPLDLPTDDQITHTVADIVLAVNDEHYSVLYLGTGVCACVFVWNLWFRSFGSALSELLCAAERHYFMQDCFIQSLCLFACTHC